MPKPITIAIGSDERVKPHDAVVIHNTSRLLAVTMATDTSVWVVTHVPTGRAFPGIQCRDKYLAQIIGKALYLAMPELFRQRTRKAMDGMWESAAQAVLDAKQGAT